MNTLPDVKIIPYPQLKGLFALDEQGTLYKLRKANKARRIEGGWTPKKIDNKTDRPGYRINLTVNGIKTVRELSQAMLDTYVSPAPSGHCAHHVNSDWSDNSLANLKWATRAEIYASRKKKDRA